MRNLAILAILLCAVPAGSFADKPKVNWTMIDAMEKSMDRKFSGLWPDDPAEVMGLTQGAYISGYGAVFMGEINLAPAAGISPFHPSISADETKRTHDKKVARLAKLREAMQHILMDSAKSLDAVPADEQVAVGVSLFYWNWENRDGLPAQIVMHAPRKLLLQFKPGATDKTSIISEEF
jgi:hypothetical protein